MRKKIFLDTNIVIDYLSNRIPLGKDALRIFFLPPQTLNSHHFHTKKSF